jgi:hypothetical protein
VLCCPTISSSLAAVRFFFFFDCLLQLFEALKSCQPGDSDWDDLVAFLQEFCSLAKHLQLLQRQNLWNKMTQLGMFEVRAELLAVLYWPNKACAVSAFFLHALCPV